MTAEVALLNRHAVALAADSAVTFTSLTGQKIYNAGNKLFALSKWEPVGVMVYGNAEFMGVPWETIIKMYRHQLGQKTFPRLEDYYSDFIAFLGRDDTLFGDDVQRLHVFRLVSGAFTDVQKELERRAQEAIGAKGSIQDREVLGLASEAINVIAGIWAGKEFTPGMDAPHATTVRSTYAAEIDRAIAQVFETLPLPDADREALRAIAGHVVTKNYFTPGHSGVVVAGYGTEEHFPALRAALVEIRTAGKLKYGHAQSQSIDHQTGSAIIPFAQVDAVQLFVQGIDPAYDKVARTFVRETLLAFPNKILETLTLGDAEKTIVREQWQKMGESLFAEFARRAAQSQRQKYVDPLLNVVAALPKDELASVAEALVNLTSLRRKVSMDAETVGGPIDVAVISKGDGLVWIRRKHYFKPELNPHFFQNYFRVEPDPVAPNS